jgi:hypothetical protein
MCGCVVVEEGHHVPDGRLDAGVPGAGQALVLLVGQHPDVVQHAGGEAVEFRAVVDDQQDLVRRTALGLDRGDGGLDVLPAAERVGAHDDGEAR